MMTGPSRLIVLEAVKSPLTVVVPACATDPPPTTSSVNRRCDPIEPSSEMAAEPERKVREYALAVLGSTTLPRIMAAFVVEVSSTVLPDNATAVLASPIVSTPLLVKAPASETLDAAVTVRPPNVNASVPESPNTTLPVLASMTALFPKVLVEPVMTRS